MNPGATTRPSALIVRRAEALDLPTPTIFPSCTATSAWNKGSPEPSAIRAFLINRSYGMVFSPCSPTPLDDRYRSRRDRDQPATDFQETLCPAPNFSKLSAGSDGEQTDDVHPVERRCRQCSRAHFEQ